MQLLGGVYHIIKDSMRLITLMHCHCKNIYQLVSEQKERSLAHSHAETKLQNSHFLEDFTIIENVLILSHE